MPRTLLSLTLLTLLAVLCACDRPGSPAKSGAGAGAPAEIELESMRIVALSPALGLMLKDLGVEDRIVGAHDWDHALGRSIPRVGSLEELDYEALLRVHPTHVLVEINMDRPLPARLVSLQKQHGWVVRRVGSINTLDDIARVMDDLFLAYVSPPEGGDTSIIGFRDPGERFSQTMPSEAFARAIDSRGPRVRGAGRVLLLGALSPPQAIGPGSFHHEVLTRLGGDSALDSGGMWQELDTEDVVRLSPDAIVLVLPRDMTDDDRFVEPPRTSVQELIRRLGSVGAQDIPAITNGRVALIDHPYAHVPAGSSMRAFADELAAILERWTYEGRGSAP